MHQLCIMEDWTRDHDACALKLGVPHSLLRLIVWQSGPISPSSSPHALPCHATGIRCFSSMFTKKFRSDNCGARASRVQVSKPNKRQYVEHANIQVAMQQGVRDASATTAVGALEWKQKLSAVCPPEISQMVLERLSRSEKDSKSTRSQLPNKSQVSTLACLPSAQMCVELAICNKEDINGTVARLLDNKDPLNVSL